MSLIKKNIAANFAGSIWQSLMALIFIPLYIKFMGIESWGLIGIFATLQTMFSLLDMGLRSTLNREIARLSVLPRKEQEMRNLVRGLEVLYWSVAVFAGITIVSLYRLLRITGFKGKIIWVKTKPNGQRRLQAGYQPGKGALWI